MRTTTEGRSSLVRELCCQQIPIIAALLAAGVGAAYLQHGFLPGGDTPFPLAGVRVPAWHLVWMGLWTGYTMALVGQAAGIVALPYCTTVLQFANPHVTPTLLVMTLFNPIGALLGFRRSGQWNLDLAAAVCLGGLTGGIIGPVLRATILADPRAFRITLGLALAVFGLQLCQRAVADYSRFGAAAGARHFDHSGSDEVSGPAIQTVSRSLRHIGIRYGNEERQLSNAWLFVAGLLVGAFSAAIGIGGGFLLVPLFAAVWRLPIYVMVAATIPYTLVLSLTGILTFLLLLPRLGMSAIDPEWCWGLFAAAGGVLGSWWASKTQIDVPEHLLGLMLGALTGTVGFLYVLSAVLRPPFRL